MAFKPVILWTDALIYLLVAAIIAFILYARGSEPLRAPWRQVGRSRVAMASLVVLMAYVGVGLLDSIHFQKVLDPDAGGEVHYAPEVLSVLDVVLAPLRAHTEKTYSAPFATHLYTKETMEGSNAGTTRGYPRLQYGGAQLANPDGDEAHDLAITAAGSTLQAAGLWMIVVCVVAGTMSLRHRRAVSATIMDIFAGRTALPWNVILYTAAVLLLLATLAGNLGLKYHVLGTDKVGQDVMYLALKSIRTGLVIGTLTTLVMLPFAVLLGIMAGYFRGRVDDVIQYLYTTLNSIPAVLLIAAAILTLQVFIGTHPEKFGNIAYRADMRLLGLCVILGITSWTGLCRLLRGETMKLSQADYIQAACAFGVKHRRIITRHILPNVMHIVLISVVLDFSGLVLAEAVLSYINIGVDPTMNSWGNMINAARLEMAREPVVWWSLLAAFIFMFVLVLAANLFSDAVRDAFDPRLREQ